MILSVALLTIVMVKPYETESLVKTLSDTELLVDGGKYSMSPALLINNYSESGYSSFGADVWGDNVVFTACVDDVNGNSTIAIYCLSNDTRYAITNETEYFKFNGRIWDNSIVYGNVAEGYTNDVYLYNISTTNLQLIPDDGYDADYLDIYGDVIIWNDADWVNLFYYNITSNSLQTLISSSPDWVTSNSIDNYRISYYIYNATTTNAWDTIGYYDLNNNTYTNISVYDDYFADTYENLWIVDINGKNMVFGCVNFLYGDFEFSNIFLYNITTDAITNITWNVNNSCQAINPHVSSHFIEYNMFNGSWHIMCYDTLTNETFELNTLGSISAYPLDQAMYTDEFDNTIVVHCEYVFDEVFVQHSNLWGIYLNSTTISPEEEHYYVYHAQFQREINVGWIYISSILITSLVCNIALIINHRKEWWWT